VQIFGTSFFKSIFCISLSLQSGLCQQTEVCCQFSDGRSANLILDNDFAAAAQSTSEVLTKEGYVVNVPSNQYLPSRPEPEFNPDASNNDPSRIKPTTAAPRCSNGAPNYPDCCTNGGSGEFENKTIGL
jgi:hypothetical protein